MRSLSPLEELAYSALEISDLANGVEGMVTISFDQSDQMENKQSKLQEILTGHRLFAESWRRCPKLEQGYFKDRSEIEFRVYKRDVSFNGKKETRWASIQLTNFLGISAVFRVTSCPFGGSW